uniref:Lipid scramblase CLPTM1L n=1 Tax=Cyclopterus lumpus TaxID=8103 RepID=A0A8C2X5H1_CYCLU
AQAPASHPFILSAHTDTSRIAYTKIPRSENTVSHWRPHLSITMMSEDFTFNKAGLPGDVRRYMRVSQEGRHMIYLPLLLVNELSFRVRDLLEISSSTVQLPLTVSYEGISLRGFRFWVHLQDVVYSLRQFGFTEENIDEIKETLVGSNLYMLVLTALITALQLICEFLALKNDFSSWRKKKSMVGMSRKLLLPDANNRHIYFQSPVNVQVNKLDEEERKTVEYDTQASRYLSYLVYPLCISGAIFSLAYLPKSEQIVFASPNLLLSSLQGVNTLISDLCSCASFFSSSGSFSSSHQLSCFRDELLFFLYLYQRRWDNPLTMLQNILQCLTQCIFLKARPGVATKHTRVSSRICFTSSQGCVT